MMDRRSHKRILELLDLRVDILSILISGSNRVLVSFTLTDRILFSHIAGMSEFSFAC